MTTASIPIADRVTDAFFALDTDFRFTYLNDRAEMLLERSREELLGRVMWDEFPATVETQFPNSFHRAMDEQICVSFEVYHTPLETWFETRAYPSETGLSVYMRDVTEQKHQETTLAQHAAVVEATHDGVVTLNRNREIVAVNSALESMLGTDRTDLIGNHIEIVPELAGIDPQDTVEIGRAITDVDVCNADRRHLEVAFTDATGTDRMGEFRIVPIEDDRATVAVVIRDVTDQHEYERVVTSLHEITQWLLESDDPEEICAIAVHAGSDLLGFPLTGIWLLDDTHGYLDPVAGTAGAHEEFGGLPRFTSGEGLTWEVFESGEITRFDDLHDVEGVYNPNTTIRSELIAPIGTHGVLMTASLEPHYFDEMDVDLVSTLVENTTAALDRAVREQVLQERTAELERQTERLESVAEILSTELKQQLDAVAEAIEDDPTETEWEFPLAENDVEPTLDRVEQLVDDVREFARNASDVGPRTRIDFESAIERAVDSSRLDNDAVIIDESATLRVDADRFANLLETAFDNIAARAESDVTVQIGVVGFENVRPSRNGHDSRGFFFLDDATEIPPTAHEQVLDPSVDDDTAIDGLGLALVRAIAEAHDWEITVDNGENGGTRLEIRNVTTLELT